MKTLEDLIKESPHTLADQQVERRKKLKCKTCGGLGVVYPEFVSAVCYGGEPGTEATMCPECWGESSPNFFFVEGGGCYSSRTAKPLW
jgi:hypothetical protein